MFPCKIFLQTTKPVSCTSRGFIAEISFLHILYENWPSEIILNLDECKSNRECIQTQVYRIMAILNAAFS